MGKIEKQHLLPSNYRYIDKSFIEMFPEKFCISHIYLAHCSVALVAMETIMQKKKKKKMEKKILKKNYLLRKQYAL